MIAMSQQRPMDELRPKNNAIVICPHHGIRCLSNRSEPSFTRYYCPSPGCPYAKKETRPKPVVPDLPKAAGDQQHSK